MSTFYGVVLILKEPDHNELEGFLRSLGGYNRKSKGIRDPIDILGLVDVHMVLSRIWS